MPTSWKPILALVVVAGVAIVLLEPNYLDLQAASTTDEFLGILGDGQRRAMAAAVVDVAFALGYGLLGVIAFQHVAVGVLRGIGIGLTLGAVVADELENALVLLAAQQRSAVSSSTIDSMGTAGSVKWGLVSAAIVLLLALAMQAGLDRRR